MATKVASKTWISRLEKTALAAVTPHFPCRQGSAARYVTQYGDER
jgi:hypothetical protein